MTTFRKPLRITFLVAAIGNGGGCRVLAHYAHGLMQLGHSVLVVSPPPRPYGRLNTALNALVPGRRSQPSNHYERLGVPITTLERFRPIKVSDVPDADVLVATWWETAIWMKNFPMSKGKKVHVVQDYEIWNGNKAAVDAALALPLPKITISNWLANIIVTLKQPTPVIIPNGIDHEQFWSPPRERPLRPTVGCVFAENPRKGMDIAIEAIQKAQVKFPDLRVVVFGHAPPAQPVNVANMVFMVSPDQDKLREIYSQCTAWLFPSREEGFGLPVLESLACRTPVIAFPSGAAPEILINGGGTLLKSFTAGEMADEILKYVQKSEDEWRRLSLAANEISKNYRWTESIQKFQDRLYDIVGEWT